MTRLRYIKGEELLTDDMAQAGGLFLTAFVCQSFEEFILCLDGDLPVSEVGGFFYFLQMPRPLPVIVDNHDEGG